MPRWAAAVALVLGATACGAGPAPPVERPLPVSFEGVTVTEFSGSTLRRRLEAAQLLVLPKRFGILQLAALRELVLTSARLQIFEDADAAHARGPGDLLVRGAAGGRRPDVPTARIAGAVVHGFECDVLREGVVDVHVTARRGAVDVRSGDLALDDLEVRLPRDRSVLARRAVWRAADGAIEIPGAYQWREGAELTRGRGLRLDPLHAGEQAPQAPRTR